MTDVAISFDRTTWIDAVWLGDPVPAAELLEPVEREMVRGSKEFFDVRVRIESDNPEEDATVQTARIELDTTEMLGDAYHVYVRLDDTDEDPIIHAGSLILV